MKLITQFVFVVILSAYAYPDTADSLQRCAAIGNDTARLTCYDGIVKQNRETTTDTAKVASKGKWVIDESTSPIDDSKKVTLLLDAESSIRNMFTTSTPTLILRCSENKTEAYINWGVFIGSLNTEVLTRFDKEKAKIQNWSASTDNKATFVPGNNVTFIKNLINHQTLFTQVVPFNENPVTTSFDLTGLNEAIKPLRDACHW